MNNKRIIAFGDIHGHYKATVRAIKLANEENAMAIFLGDYIDRGPDSIKTLEVLITAKKNNPNWIFLRGNHDQMLLDLINGKQKTNVIFDVISGKTSNKEASKVFLEWQNCSEMLKKEMILFLESTVFYYEIDDWIFVHAPLRESNVPLEKKNNDELIWNYNLIPSWEGKQFIHGHAVVELPTKINKGLNINTGCGFGGKLTGMLIKISLTSTGVSNEEIINFSISESGVLI